MLLCLFLLLLLLYVDCWFRVIYFVVRCVCLVVIVDWVICFVLLLCVDVVTCAFYILFVMFAFVRRVCCLLPLFVYILHWFVFLVGVLFVFGGSAFPLLLGMLCVMLFLDLCLGSFCFVDFSFR